MRINKYLALATGLSRRDSDKIISNGEILVNGLPPQIGQDITDSDLVEWRGEIVKPEQKVTIMLNKPVGYVCSRDGQGSQTIYNLLPPNYHSLKSVGRLDKNSSGLILLTNDGELANNLAHPSKVKEKTYRVRLDRALTTDDIVKLRNGIKVEDYISKLQVELLGDKLNIRMTQGKNRQIRKTFSALGYDVQALHRTNFGYFEIGDLPSGHYITVNSDSKT